MLYAITITQRARGRTRVTRHVEETLPNAQAYLSGLISTILDWPSDVAAAARAADQLWGLRAAGGQIGPLPDDTLIDVALVSEEWVGFDLARRAPRALLETYNRVAVA